MANKESEFILSNYNTHKFGEDDILITNKQGSWALLSKKEFDKFRLGKFKEDSKIKSFLEEKGFIIDQNNVQNVVNSQFNKKKFLFQGTSLHILTPTLSCNQRCIYCHSKSRSQNSNKNFDMDMETAKSVVDFALKSPSKNIRFEFQGGEPLLNFSVIEETVKHAKMRSKNLDKKIGFSLVSNLLSLDDEKAEFIKKHKIQLSTSLDGPKAVHDHNRKYLGGKSSYKKLVKKIDLASSHGLDINALCTITKKSMKYGEAIVDKYIELGFDKIWLRPLNKIGFAKEEWNEIGYNPEEFLNFYKETLNYILNQKEGKIIEIMALIFSKKILGEKDPVMTDIMSPCGAGISQLLYNYKGELYTCDEGKAFDEFKVGDVKNSEWNDIFENDTTLSMVDISSKESLLCDNCEWKPYCGICPVNIYSEQGSVVPKLSQDRRCKTYSGIIEFIFEKLLFSQTQRDIIQNWAEKDRIYD